MEPTSEQELKQLLDEGRITEDEYKELHETLRQKESIQKPVEVPEPTKSKASSGYGKAALILMITGFILPIAAIVVGVLIIRVFGIRMDMYLFLPCLLIAFLCELLAFIFGIVGWRTPQGKVTAIGVPCLGLLLIPGLLIVSYVATRVAYVPAESQDFVIHKRFPLDSTVGVLTKEGGQEFDVNIDHNNSIDGGASLKITSKLAHKQVIRLFETGPIDVENRLLLYLAQLKSDLQNGGAYLEMWCQIPGKGEFFSRLSEQPISGKTNWTSFRTPFRLETGQIPDNVKLNLVIEGIGTVWVDGVVLASSPLN